MAFSISDTYYALLAKIESNNRPQVKASTSSASGLYQFVKSTAQSLGLPWGNDPTKAFGGASVSVDQQNTAIKKLTTQNATYLDKLGIAINNATLYAAHFLGVGTAGKLLKADPNSSAAAIAGPAAVSANPTIFTPGLTVQGFFDWLKKKTGAAVNSGASAQQVTERCASCGQLIRSGG